MTMTQRHETTTAVRLNPPGTNFGRNVHKIHGPQWCAVLVDTLGGTAGEPAGFVARTLAEEAALDEAARDVLPSFSYPRSHFSRRGWGHCDADETTTELLEAHAKDFPEHAAAILRPGLFQRLAGAAMLRASELERAARIGESHGNPVLETRRRAAAASAEGVRVEFDAIDRADSVHNFLTSEVLLGGRRVGAFRSEIHAALFAAALLDALAAGDAELLADIAARRALRTADERQESSQ